MKQVDKNNMSYEKLLYSKLLDKVYKEDELDKLLSDESAYKKELEEKENKKKARKARAEEINQARETMNKAIKEYNDLISAFVKDYGSYHYTTTNTDTDKFNRLLGITDLFDFMRLF